jgi:branched-chain amino acid transport system substrate-binding protein
MLRRNLMLTAAGAVLASLMMAGPGAAQEKITLGASAPKTGPLAAGAEVTHWPAIHLWVNDVNARGGIDVGGTKMLVEVIEADDKTSGEEAIKNYQRFATVDNVDFVIAPYSTGLNIAAAPIIAQYGYPQLGATAVGDGFEALAARWPNSYWLLGSSKAFAEDLAGVLKGMRDAGKIGNRVAVVNVADAFGIELMAAGKPALEAAGFEIVYETSYPLQQQDFAPIIQGAQAADPDAFVAFSYPGDTFGLSAQAKIANLDVGAFYVGVATAFPAYLGANGAAAEGVLGAGGINPDAPGMQEWRARHKEVTGSDADYWASAMTYASLEILEQAITRAGSLDKAAVLAAIKTAPFNTVMGELDLTNNVNPKFWTVGQWQGGVFYGVAADGFEDVKAPIVKSGWGE